MKFAHVPLADDEVVEARQHRRHLATPGHAPAHRLRCPTAAGATRAWLIFTGDSLLVGDVGRPDLHAAGDPEPLARQLYGSIGRLLELPDGVLVYPSTSAARSAAALSPATPSPRLASSAHPQRRACVPGRRWHARALLIDLPPAPADQTAIVAANRAGAAPRQAGVTSRRLGLRASWRQFSLLVGLNALVGAMVGLGRSVLPLVGEEDFGLVSRTAILSFVVAFGVAKALTNLAAGGLADRVGRKQLLTLGWLLALPVPLLIALAPSWGWIVAANVLLGANQGLAWSMTVVMKIDLAGPARRRSRSASTSRPAISESRPRRSSPALAASFAPRSVVWVGALAIAFAGVAISIFFVHDTGAHVAHDAPARDGRAPRSGDVRRDQLPPAGAARLLASRPRPTTSTTRSRGLWPRSTSPPTAPAPRRSGSSPPSTRPSGAPGNSSPAGSPTTPAASP